MKICDAIQIMKNYCKGIGFDGNPIDESKTRDKILYGNPNQEITGIITTCYASVDVVKKAIESGANFIIVHEALFWNHGDHTDWLQDNNTFKEKNRKTHKKVTKQEFTIENINFKTQIIIDNSIK